MEMIFFEALKKSELGPLALDISAVANYLKPTSTTPLKPFSFKLQMFSS